MQLKVETSGNIAITCQPPNITQTTALEVSVRGTRVRLYDISPFLALPGRCTLLDGFRNDQWAWAIGKDRPACLIFKKLFTVCVFTSVMVTNRSTADSALPEEMKLCTKC